MVSFIVIVQGLLFLAHALVLVTLKYFKGKPDIPHLPEFLLLASISFVPASLLVWRSTHLFASLFYRLAAIWLGCLSFFFCASILCWLVWAILLPFSGQASKLGPVLVAVCFGLATVASATSLINGSSIRVTQVCVNLPGLPEAWRGRSIVLVSDLHLGPVHGLRFSGRVAALVAKLNPNLVALTGDFYDGTAVDAPRMASAWKDLAARREVYYVTGNHEEFSDRAKYLQALEGAGIRILRNQKVLIDGLQIAGILYGEGSEPSEFRQALAGLKLNPGNPSILLNHVPQFFELAEQAGVSLMLSGHTHKGQVMPWSWVARRVHGPFAYGLNRFKSMLVYTTSGAGTWGPPMRLGSSSEIVEIRFA